MLPRTRQTLLFSATLSTAVVRLSAEFTREPLRVDVSEGDAVPPTVTHRVYPVALDRKRDLLLHLVTQAPAGQALVFCRTKRGADRVGAHLASARLSVGVIHGNKSQGARSRALADFKAGRAAVLVATDVAARGLDIPQLPLVVNYDVPLVAEDYIHRVGRTGRAGLAGRAISLVTASERELLRDIQRLLPAPLEHVVVDGFEKTDAPTLGGQHRRESGRSGLERATKQGVGASRRSRPGARRPAVGIDRPRPRRSPGFAHSR